MFSCGQAKHGSTHSDSQANDGRFHGDSFKSPPRHLGGFLRRERGIGDSELCAGAPSAYERFDRPCADLSGRLVAAAARTRVILLFEPFNKPFGKAAQLRFCIEGLFSVAAVTINWIEVRHRWPKVRLLGLEPKTYGLKGNPCQSQKSPTFPEEYQDFIPSGACCKALQGIARIAAELQYCGDQSGSVPGCEARRFRAPVK